GLPTHLYGSIGGMFDRVVAEHPEYLTLPGPGEQTPATRYSSEILVSILGFSMWPHMFMKCFTARSARLVQLSVVFYPSFLFFLLPLIFLGYVAVLGGGPADDSVLLWLVDLVADQPAYPLLFAFLAFAVLAASMSTGDALLHAGGSIAIRAALRPAGGWLGTRDVLLPIESRPLGRALSRGARAIRLLRAPARPGQRLRDDDLGQTRAMKLVVVMLALITWLLLADAGRLSIVDLLLLAYAIPVQFLPLVIFGLYWRRANGVGASVGLLAGLATVLALFVLQKLAPELAAAINPLELEIGVLGLVVNTLGVVIFSLAGPRPSAALLQRFEL